jgi:preprotein translocase subunit SecG
MRASTWIAILAVVLVVVVLALKSKLGGLGANSGSAALPTFKRKPFLTANETEFLSRLEAAARQAA